MFPSLWVMTARLIHAGQRHFACPIRMYAPEQKWTTLRRNSGVTWRSKSRPPPDSDFTDTMSCSGSRTRFGIVEKLCIPWDTGGLYTVELLARARRAVFVDSGS